MCQDFFTIDAEGKYCFYKGSKSSGGDSISHSESLYSVIQTPTEEIDVFFDVSQQLPQSQQSSGKWGFQPSQHLPAQS